MAYVINGGVKPSSRFHDFVDLCCQAFNITRRHANIFFNLFGLMLNSGILELSQVEDIKYVQNALKPSATDAEATVMFTRLIESSLGAKSTQINFFIHNLAQLKFHSASNDTGVLSFSSKIHTLANDGRISSATVFGFQKRYNPEKYYIYIIKVSREKETEPAFVFRKFSEFHELNDKITATYPKIRLPILSSKHILGRTHIQQVAEKRKGEIQAWLNSLFAMAPEVSECDLVYTFFHPLLRDERDVDLISMVKPKVFDSNSVFLQLIYNLPLCEIRSRTLQITVWDCDYLKENDFMGAAYISLNSINLTQETVEWYKLGSFHRM
ncbi:phosphatidylinositol 4-phosphate 3-kinase C2 domain-containing subunit alpha-like [Saccoglossus kowalevskii]